MTISPYSLLLFTVSAGCIALAFSTRKRWLSPDPNYLFGMLLAISLAAFSYGMMLTGPRLELQFIFLVTRYMGDLSYLVLMLFMVLWYTGTAPVLRRKYWALFFISPVLNLLVLISNPWHHLYYTHVWLDLTGPTPLLAKTNGPLYPIFMVLTYIIFAFYLVILRYTLRVPRYYRRQSLLLLLGTFSPILAHLAYLFGMRLWGFLNPVYFVYAFSSGTIAVAVLRFRLVELRPFARETIIRTIPTGVIVLDSDLNIVEMNPAARRALQVPAAFPLSHPLVQANVDLDRWLRLANPENPGQPDELLLTTSQPDGTRYFSSIATPILEQLQSIGWIVVMTDITASRELDKKLIEQQRAYAALDERERLARELHDRLGQVMGYINVQSQTALTYLDSGQPELTRAALDYLSELSHTFMLDLREFLFGLRQRFDDTTDFYSSLQKYLAGFTSIYKLPVSIDLPPEEARPSLPPFVEVHLLRIIQEGLSNVRKHAAAAHAWVHISVHEGEVKVLIEDDGRGFIPPNDGPSSTEAGQAPAAGEASLHFGRQIMRDRAAEIGGRLDTISAPGRGTRVLVTFPLPQIAQSDRRLGHIRVLLADDHPLYRDGLRNLLSARGADVVAVAKNGVEAVEMAAAHHPDVAILDIRMPEKDGLQALAEIRQKAPDVRVLILTVEVDEDLLIQAMRAGAAGYLLKDLNAERFCEHLEALMRGEKVIADSLSGKLARRYTEITTSEKDEFNERQLSILKLLAASITYDQIGERLHLSTSTVKYHVKNLMEKLNAGTRAELIDEAARRGLVERRTFYPSSKKE